MLQETKLENEILELLKKYKVIKGTGNLTLMVSTNKCKTYVINQSRKLETLGYITIIRSTGGRGRRTVYKKRNRNSPGAARRKAAR